jgi:hypothetical protein
MNENNETALDVNREFAAKVEVWSLDAQIEDVDGEPWLGFAEPGVPNPAGRYASAMDLESWLGSLDAEDRLALAPPAPANDAEPSAERSRRSGPHYRPWAELLLRCLSIDVLSCAG